MKKPSLCLTLLLLCGCRFLPGGSLLRDPAWTVESQLGVPGDFGLTNLSMDYAEDQMRPARDTSARAPMNALPALVLFKSRYNMPISWENPTNQVAAYNRVYLGAVQGSRTRTWQIPLTNKFTLPNLTNGVLHYFEVVTVNTNGRESAALAGQIKIDFRK